MSEGGQKVWQKVGMQKEDIRWAEGGQKVCQKEDRRFGRRGTEGVQEEIDWGGGGQRGENHV